MDPLISSIKLTPKQWEFIQAKEREVMFAGAKGSGKSYAGCVKLLTHAVLPHSFCLLTRKTHNSIASSTLRTLLIGERDVPAVLPRGSYDYWESKSLIRINGGGEIVIVGCDNPEKIRSINASTIYVDEGSELDEEEYAELSSRLRNTADPNRQLFTTTNPSSEKHFLYNRFITHGDNTRKLIKVPLFDKDGKLNNYHLPSDYIEDMMKLTGSALKRYVWAEWCSNEGCVYDTFDPSRHVENHSRDEFTEFIIGVDVGYVNDPTAILVFGVKDGKMHGLEEYYQVKTPPSLIVSKVAEMSEKYGNCRTVVDPSAAGIILELMTRTTVDKANNKIEEGIARCKDLLINSKITFNSNMVNTIKEFDLYAYKPETGKGVPSEKPLDKWNHSMDALRYAVAKFYDDMAMRLCPFIPELIDESPEQREEAMWSNA